MTFSKDNLIASSELVDIYRDGDTCIKLFKEGVRKTNPLYEALTHSRVEDTGLRVPVIHELSVIDGRWAIHMDLIEGKTLAEMMKEDPDNMDKYLDDFVNIQLEIHSKQVPKLSKLKDKISRQINSLTEIDDVKKYELLTRLESMPKHYKVCHGDFNPSNVIVGKNGKMTVVDWAHATQGNASADAAMTYLLFALKDQEAADMYMNMFCKKSDTARQYVQQWLPIVAAAQLTKDNELEKDFLMRWIDVIDYQ